MVDWKDPVVLQTVGNFYSKSLLFILGLYIWEIVVTFDFEKNFLFSETRHPWRWHYASYFVCRYSFLITTILLIFVMNTTLPMNCQVTLTVSQFFGNITMGTASLNLAFRTVAIWRNNRVLSMLLVAFAGGHWFVLIFCVTTLKAVKNNMGSAPSCLITDIGRPWLLALYVYTMIFDTFIMVACSMGLWRSKPRAGGRADDLYKLLWTDGLLYFVCASVLNALPVLFFVLDLNPAMDTISNMVSACLTTILSCRAVQRLTVWGRSNTGTQETAYKMDRSGRSDTRKPSSIAATGIEHGRKPWNKRRDFPSEGDVHLSSAMFAKTACADNEGPDPRNEEEYDGQPKSRNDGGPFSLQFSRASSPTIPEPWMQTPSVKSGSTSNDKEIGTLPYQPTTMRVPELSEQSTFPTEPSSLHESIEEDERVGRDPRGLSPYTIPSLRAGRRVIRAGPVEVV